MKNAHKLHTLKYPTKLFFKWVLQHFIFIHGLFSTNNSEKYIYSGTLCPCEAGAHGRQAVVYHVMSKRYAFF